MTGLVRRLVDTGMSPIKAVQFEELENVADASGWAYHIDGSGTQSFAAGVRTQFTVDNATVLDSQKPSDITTFWDAASNVLTGLDGDDRVMRVGFDAAPDDATANSVVIELDIGGAQGVIAQKAVSVTTGAGVTQPISEEFELFCGATFEANGCAVYLTFDGPVTVGSKTILGKRNHRRR